MNYDDGYIKRGNRNWIVNYWNSLFMTSSILQYESAWIPTWEKVLIFIKHHIRNSQGYILIIFIWFFWLFINTHILHICEIFFSEVDCLVYIIRQKVTSQKNTIFREKINKCKYKRWAQLSISLLSTTYRYMQHSHNLKLWFFNFAFNVFTVN